MTSNLASTSLVMEPTTARLLNPARMAIHLGGGPHKPSALVFEMIDRSLSTEELVFT